MQFGELSSRKVTQRYKYKMLVVIPAPPNGRDKVMNRKIGWKNAAVLTNCGQKSYFFKFHKNV